MCSIARCLHSTEVQKCACVLNSQTKGTRIVFLYQFLYIRNMMDYRCLSECTRSINPSSIDKCVSPFVVLGPEGLERDTHGQNSGSTTFIIMIVSTNKQPGNDAFWDVEPHDVMNSSYLDASQSSQWLKPFLMIAIMSGSRANSEAWVRCDVHCLQHLYGVSSRCPQSRP